jgi:hypothetical protein
MTTIIYDPNNPYTGFHSTNFLNIEKIIFNNITEETIIQILPPSIQNIELLDSPGIIFHPHPSQNNVTEFHFISYVTREEYQHSMGKSDFSAFTQIEKYTTDHTPLLPFYNANITIMDATIHPGDIHINHKIHLIRECTFISVFELPSITIFFVNGCTFHENKLPILPNVTHLYLYHCNDEIQFSNFPMKLQYVYYKNMNIHFKEQLEEIQLNILDLIPENELLKETYSTKNEKLIRILKNDETHQFHKNFFKKALNTHKQDLAHHELVLRHLTGSLKTKVSDKPMTRSRKQLTTGKAQPRNTAIETVMTRPGLSEHVLGFLKNNIHNENDKKMKGRGTKKRKIRKKTSR